MIFCKKRDGGTRADFVKKIIFFDEILKVFDEKTLKNVKVRVRDKDNRFKRTFEGRKMLKNVKVRVRT